MIRTIVRQDLPQPNVDVIEIDDVKQLPKMFEAFTANTPVSDCVRMFAEKHGYEPTVLYRMKRGTTKMIAMEIKA
jgi:hypothetical protein